MSMVTTQCWETIHSWDSDKWETEDEWTDAKMIDELNALRRFLKEKIPSMTLNDALEKIEDEGTIRKGNTIYDFTALKEIIGIWNHLSETCKNFGRYWIAQDESYLACLIDEKRSCNRDHQNPACSDYAPMVKLTPISKLANQTFVFR
jgi:hypothetical protein